MIDLVKKEELEKEIQTINRLTKMFSMARFGLVLCAIIFFICFLSLEQYSLYLGISIAFLVLLAAVIIFTNPYYHKQKLLKNMELVYKKHQNRRNLSYQSFTPDGREFIHYEDYKVLDLDTLGPKSLFQYLCVAKSQEGRRKLARQLTNPEKKSEAFTNCIHTLANHPASLKLESSISAISNEAKDCDNEELLGLMKKRITIPSLGILLMIASYCLWIGLLCFFLFNGIDPYYVLFFIPINFIIARKFTNNDVFSLPATKYADLLTAYTKLAEDVLEMKIEDPYFEDLQQILEEELPRIKQYKNMFEMLSYRKNLILSLIGNGIFYMDYWIALRFNLHKNKIESIERSLDALSELELMMSLAVIGMDNLVYSIPVLGKEIRIEQGYHPLVRNCVPNDFQFAGGIILTGSNMSGKTTFMRMLGVNQILANAGGIVCAKSFQTRDYAVVTSLRANDMLQEGISTFYAEINRMKRIMQETASQPTLALIDEIFKGTNAKDRIYASKQIIQKLLKADTSFIITTHDFELCDAAGIENYHFDEEYMEDKISFDYKIKKGICQKTNALYLLKLAGVLETSEER